jgi:photosystem II stability/assembly factor-like uncharacterized protein
MKYPVYCLAMCVAMLTASAAADWASIGPEGGQIYSMVQNEATGVLYGASGSYPVKVMKSTDGGLSWTTAGTFSGYEYCMACGPTGTLFCGGSSYTYTSTNGGATWSSSYQQNTIFYDIVAHPTDPQIVYGSGYRYNGSIWQWFFGASTNAGSTWTYTTMATDQSYGYGVAVSRSNPSVVYCTGYVYTGSTYIPKICRSTDGGTSFTDVTPAGAASEYYGYSCAIHPTNPNTVLWGSLYGIWRSTDGGATWTDCSSTTYNYNLTYSLSNPNLVYAGGYNNILKSTNGGQTWTSITSGLTGNYFYDVIPSNTDETRAYTGSTFGAFRSTNTGTNWTMNNTGLLLGRDMAIGIAPSQTSLILKQMQGCGVWKSTNYGSTWTTMTMPLSCGDFCGIVFSPSSANTILALEGSG